MFVWLGVLRSCLAVQVGFKLLRSRDPSASSETTGKYQHAQCYKMSMLKVSAKESGLTGKNTHKANVFTWYAMSLCG